MTEEENLVSNSNPPKSKLHPLAVFVGTSILAIIISILVVVSVNLAKTVELKSFEIDQPKQLPSSFGVYTAGSVRDQYSRGTCWAFATMRFLEDRYRVQGIAKKHFTENQYVAFSDQAHGINMINFCKANPQKCPDTPQSTQSIATDGYPSWLYHFQEYLNDKLVVDLKSCPYTPSESNLTDIQCPGMVEFQNTKRLKYRVKSYKSLNQIPEIKQALIEKNSTFPLVTELLWQDYYVSCNNPAYSQTNTCTNKTYLCPIDMQSAQQDEYCVRFSLMTTADSEFIARDKNRIRTGVGAHAMLLVGYNDQKEFQGSKGGFIVQNSWGPVLGHSLDYLQGKISRRAEQYQCPNVNNPYEWIPVDYEGEDKYKLRAPTVLQLTVTNDSFGAKQGHFHVDGISPIQEYMKSQNVFNLKSYYIIKNITDNVDGTVQVTFAVSDKPQPDQNFSDLTNFAKFPPVPFDFLVHFFEPVKQYHNASNSPECGYYYIPYKFVDSVNAVQGLFFIDQMEIEFDEKSYLRQNDKKPGSTKMTEALREQNRIQWTTHTPWLQNDTWLPKFK